MSMILVGILAVAAIVMLLSLFKKLIKLAFSLFFFILLLIGIWYLMEENPNMLSALHPTQGGNPGLMEVV